MPSFLDQNKRVLLLLVFFTLLYASISLVNHFLFRTSALDLGLYTNAAWKYAHFILPDRSLFRWDNDPLLADHFDLHLIFWAPLTYIFGDRTLLIVQIIAIPVGAFGVYKFSNAVSGNSFLAAIALLSTLCFYGVFSALSFDFHSNVVACMALPWYFYFLYRGKLHASWLLVVFMLLAKENMGLWVGTVSLACLGLTCFNTVPRRYLIGQSVVAFAWSLLCIGLIMPALDNNSSYHQMSQYSVLGTSSSEILETIISHPFKIFRAFFEDVEQKHPYGTGVKLEFYFILLISGGWALLRSWPFLLMAFPLVAQKMLHSDSGKWGLFSHYSIEFAVILPLAVFSVILSLRSSILQKTIGGLSLVLTIAATFYCLEFPLEHSKGEHFSHNNMRFYQARHYEQYLDQVAVGEAMALIPSDASVSAMYPLVPHLIARKDLFQFPLGPDCDYILIVTGIDPYPLTPEALQVELSNLKSDVSWSLRYDRSNVFLFEKYKK